MERKLLDFLKMNEVEYKENIRLKSCSSVKIGGIACVVIFPDSDEKMITALDFLWKNKIDYKVVGRLTNILISDNISDLVFIKTDNLRGILKHNGKIRLCAGERICALSSVFAKEGISSFSNLSGIPGSVGGMIRNNAGAYRTEISDIIESAIAYSPEISNKVFLTKEDMLFGYRSSIFQNSHLVILCADFKIISDIPENISKTISEIKQKRINAQPLSYPSLGSVFKRPIGDFAARLIDGAGLKGFSIGDAAVSEKHAGFIINKGNATFEDFQMLVEYVKQTVYKKYGILLDEEIEII
jgi:UDP-N-acetylmuramate dehydrogenase